MFADVVPVAIEKRFRSVTEVLVADSTTEWIRVHYTLKTESKGFKLQRESVPPPAPPGRRLGLRTPPQAIDSRAVGLLLEDVRIERANPELEEPAAVDDAI